MDNAAPAVAEYPVKYFEIKSYLVASSCVIVARESIMNAKATGDFDGILSEAISADWTSIDTPWENRREQCSTIGQS